MRPLGKKGSYNSLVDRVYSDNVAFNDDVRKYRLLSKELDQVKQEIAIRMSQDAAIHQERRIEHYKVEEVKAPTKAQLKAQAVNTKIREDLFKDEQKDEAEATARIVQAVRNEMQEAEHEYLDLLNERVQAIELMEEIMKRTELGNITDFWEPDTQETLEQKFNSTKEQIDKFDKRIKELEELLNSKTNKQFMDYTPPEQVMVNAPSTVNEYHFENDNDNPLTNAPSTINDWSM